MTTYSRREFLRVSSLVAASAIAAACASPQQPTEPEGSVVSTTPSSPSTAPEAAPSRFSEAPWLAEQVQSGSLPPVEERLPKSPAIVTPHQSVGQYGGTWNAAILSVSALRTLYQPAYDEMLRFEQVVEGDTINPLVVPNVAESWEANEDGSVYVLHLREGLKWSDGVPMTADDIMFWYEDVLMNPEMTASIAFWWKIEGQPMQMEKLDDYTIRISFVATHAMFPEWLASMDASPRFMPKHYLSQFHSNYADKDELDKMVQEAGVDSWMTLYGNKNSLQNPDFPTHRMWLVDIPESATSGARSVYKTNPYYWKVDTEGNQLPYLKNLAYDIVSDAEMINLKCVQGELDAHFGISWAEYIILSESAEQGDYHVVRWTSETISGITLNMSYAETSFREIIRDVRFRNALSYAIDREEINEIIFHGLGRPIGATLVPESPFFNEEYANAQVEYSPDKANALLDDMGLTERDAEGYRLRSDGQRLGLTVEAWRESFTNSVADELELMKKHFKAVGVELSYKAEDRTVARNRTMTGESQAKWGGMSYAFYPYDPTYLTPSRDLTYFAPKEGIWYTTGGAEGDEPTGDLKAMCDLWDQVVSEVDKDKRAELFDQILAIHAKNNYYLNTVGALPTLAVVKNSLQNVPERGMYDWICGCQYGWAHPEQFWQQS